MVNGQHRGSQGVRPYKIEQKNETTIPKTKKTKEPTRTKPSTSTNMKNNNHKPAQTSNRTTIGHDNLLSSLNYYMKEGSLEGV
jgi:hypothetical protein